MQSNSQTRHELIQKMRQSLKQNTKLFKNSQKIQAKQQRNRSRRLSLQLADVFQSERLLRKFSDEDEEEDQNNINSFNKKYELKYKIGQGANAVVHACLYRSSNRMYAVKIITMDEEHLLELKKNFLSIRQIRHPSIIKYNAMYFDMQKSVAYLIMEYFPFPNLLQLGVIDEQQLKIIFGSLFEAVNYLHDRNICHRDIKPENILYDAQQKRIKIIDFGISKKTYQRGVKRQMLTIIGTPQYMAPQILQGGGYDQKIDIWCIGVTLYRIITGTTPFESTYHSETVNNIIQGKISFEPTIWAKWSFFIKDLVIRLLKNSEERLSGKEASLHFWFNDWNTQQNRMRRKSHNQPQLHRHATFNIRLFKTFHDETTNSKNAISKQQDTGKSNSPMWLAQKKIRRQLHLIQNKEFDLQESSDDGSSPSTVHSVKQQQRHDLNGL